MQRDNPIKHFLLALGLALAGYACFYFGIEYLRNRKGPWTVTFRKGSGDVPVLEIDQPRLKLRKFELTFPGETSTNLTTPATLRFDQPRPVPYPVPFGNCIFMDTTFLPGTVTFQLFEHEIELLPRVLIVDHQEYSWQDRTNFVVPNRRVREAEFLKR